jgi:hypothetical protein
MLTSDSSSVYEQAKSVLFRCQSMKKPLLLVARPSERHSLRREERRREHCKDTHTQARARALYEQMPTFEPSRSKVEKRFCLQTKSIMSAPSRLYGDAGRFSDVNIQIAK